MDESKIRSDEEKKAMFKFWEINSEKYPSDCSFCKKIFISNKGLNNNNQLLFSNILNLRACDRCLSECMTEIGTYLNKKKNKDNDMEKKKEDDVEYFTVKKFPDKNTGCTTHNCNLCLENTYGTNSVVVVERYNQYDYTFCRNCAENLIGKLGKFLEDNPKAKCKHNLKDLVFNEYKTGNLYCACNKCWKTIEGNEVFEVLLRSQQEFKKTYEDR